LFAKIFRRAPLQLDTPTFFDQGTSMIKCLFGTNPWPVISVCIFAIAGAMGLVASILITCIPRCVKLYETRQTRRALATLIRGTRSLEGQPFVHDPVVENADAVPPMDPACCRCVSAYGVVFRCVMVFMTSTFFAVWALALPDPQWNGAYVIALCVIGTSILVVQGSGLLVLEKLHTRTTMWWGVALKLFSPWIQLDAQDSSALEVRWDLSLVYIALINNVMIVFVGVSRLWFVSYEYLVLLAWSVCVRFLPTRKVDAQRRAANAWVFNSLFSVAFFAGEVRDDGYYSLAYGLVASVATVMYLVCVSICVLAAVDESNRHIFKVETSHYSTRLLATCVIFVVGHVAVAIFETYNHDSKAKPWAVIIISFVLLTLPWRLLLRKQCNGKDK
jgi:hypothetical protein